MIVAKPLIICSLFTLSLYPAFSLADGLSELKNALNRLQGNDSITLELDSLTMDTEGEGDKKIITHGGVKVWLKDNTSGLQVLYSDHVLNSLEQEARLKAEDEAVETPISNAIDDIDASELHSMLSASTSLLRDINQAKFIDEQKTVHEGKDSRVLRFKLPMEFFISDEQVRSYVDEFEAQYLVWIDRDGTPIESQIEFNGRGRVFVFFKISAKGSTFSKYQVLDNRLLIARKQRHFQNASSLGVFENSEVKTLNIP